MGTHFLRVTIASAVVVFLAGCATVLGPSPSISLADVAARGALRPGDQVRVTTLVGERIEGALVAIGRDGIAGETTITTGTPAGVRQLRESDVRDIWRRRSRSQSALNGAAVLGLFGGGLSAYVAFVTASGCTEDARSRGEPCLRYRDVPAATVGWAAIGAGIGASWRSSKHVFTADRKGR